MTIRHLSGKKYNLYHLLACLGHRTVEVVAARAAALLSSFSTYLL
jgi:hypothetical protein